MIRLAFYCGVGRLPDRVIRWVTRSRFSHVELVAPDGMAISASGRDGGVRWKRLDLTSPHWAIVPVPWASWRAIEEVAVHVGDRYDFGAVLASQVFNFRRQDSKRWFCSELCAYGLGMADPHRYSPGDLYTAALERNAIFDRGRREAGKAPEESAAAG